MLRIFPYIALVVLTASLSACCPCVRQAPPASAGGPVVHMHAPAPAAAVAVQAPVAAQGPVAGDVLQVSIAGQKELSRAYTVGPDGAITMPLVGKVAVAGQPKNALAGVIADSYRAGYLVDPKVSVEVEAQ